MQKRKMAAAALVAALSVAAADASAAAARSSARGRYLVMIGGCNDCHTEGYAPSGGKVPQKDWLLGSRLGYRGPWGTTYPPNLRKYFATLTEDAWVKQARTMKTRPPMPYFALNEMREPDLRAIYRFVRGLSPLGEDAPAALPPGKEAPQPYVQWPAGPN